MKAVISAMRKLLPRDVATFHPVDVYVHCRVGDDGVGEATVTLAERQYNSGLNRDIRHEFQIPCRVIWGWKGSARRCPDGYHTYQGSPNASVYKPSGGYFHLSRSAFTSAIHSMPADAEVRLVVGLDRETNGNLAEHGFHGDVVELACQFSVRGKPVKQTYHVGIQIGPHDSGRFGSPGSCIGAYEEHRFEAA